MNRLRQQGGAGILEQEAAGPGLQCAMHILIQVEGRDHDDGQWVRDVRAGEPAGGLDPVEDGHPDVDEADIGAQTAGEPHRLGAVGGLRDDLDAGLRVKDHGQAGPDDVLVVGDQHADRHTGPPCFGTTASTLQPPSGTEPARRVPPRSVARSI